MEGLPTGSGATDIFQTRRVLVNNMRGSGCIQFEHQIKLLKKFVETQTKCPKDELPELYKKLSFFVCDFKKRWQEWKRTYERFLTKNQNWLDGSISFTNYVVSSKKVGTPSLTFETSSDRTKRKKTESLKTKYSPEELSFATHMSLRCTGKVEASKVVKEVTATSPRRAAKYRTAYKKYSAPLTKKLTGAPALAMYVEAKLTSHQYNVIRHHDRERFPSYKILLAAKKNCYPQKENIVVNETVAEVKLQALLDHTASRLLDVQQDVLSTSQLATCEKLTLIYKWGFDGSGQAEYKQKFEADTSASDANIFISSLVPLRLISEKPQKQEEIVFWQNDRSSSTGYCRPIRLQFKHETKDLSIEEKKYIEAQIQQLRPLIYEFNNMEIEVNYKMLFTMVDGKVCNAVTGTTSTQRCFVCGLTSKDFTNFEKVSSAKLVDISRLEFGLSVLHAWIRFFECVLHLAYKLPLKKLQSRGDENKEVVANTKKHIQDRFRKELGILVDKPKPGFGSTNDGNTARRFFYNSEISADINGVNIKIIKRFKIILQNISSGHEINVGKYYAYALETEKLFIEQYPWYPMPPTVRKVLIHGSKIIDHAILPIRQLSEEAQEARNKEFKRYRECYSRKISRTKTNQDVLNLLLITSDPFISSLRRLTKKREVPFEKDVLALLKAPDIRYSLDSDDNESLGAGDSDASDGMCENLYF